MEMKFDGNEDLCFGVHTKPGFQQKYLNVGSTHTAACKKAVPHGVSIRLAGLITRTAQNEGESLSAIYPEIHDALKAAGYFKGGSKLPRLGQVLDSRERESMEAELQKDEVWKKDKRNTYVLSRFSGNWRNKPIHKVIKGLKDQRGLGWLRVRMVYKRHLNLKEMLLGDLHNKCMRGVDTAEHAKKTRKKKCTCRSSHLVNGQCIYGEECETEAVIYKVTCKCCGEIYLGKTQNSLKKRIQKHYQDVGRFLKTRKAAERRLEQPLPDDALLTPQSSQTEGNNQPVLTRSSTRSRNFQTPATAASQSSITGMSYLLSLFSQSRDRTTPAHPRQSQPTIPEDEAFAGGDSSPNQPNRLTNNPDYTLSDQESIAESKSSDEGSQASDNTSLDPFGRAFGGREALGELSELERTRTSILSPILEKAYQGIQVSNLSRHMWAHVQNKTWASNDELFAWIREHWTIDIVHKGNMISHMKSAGTKSCSLCMQERVHLWFAFHKQRSQKLKLMNSRTELYSRCSCKSRFVRLEAVGQGGADEATS